MVHRCDLVTTNAGKDKDGLRLSSEKGAKLLPKKSLTDAIIDTSNDSKQQLSRSKVLSPNSNKHKSLASSSSSKNSQSLPSAEHSNPLHKHQQDASAVRVSRSKHTQKNNESLPSSSKARSGLRSSSLESCTSSSNITTDRNSNIATQPDNTQKKKITKKFGVKSKTNIDLKKSISVENVFTQHKQQQQQQQQQQQRKQSTKLHSNAQNKIQMNTPLPLSFICSLPLDKLSGILDHLKILNTEKKDKLLVGAAADHNDVDEDEKNTSNLIKSLCLYCDKKFSTQKMRFKHTERFHTLAKDRRSSSRNPNSISSAPGTISSSTVSPSPSVSPSSSSSTALTTSSSLSSSSSSTSTSTSTSTSSLSAIIISHHGCSYCSKSQKLQCIAAANDLDSLFYHMVDQHSDKYFGCKLCAIRFQSIDKLDEHMQNIHQDYKLSNKNLSERLITTSTTIELVKTVDWDKASESLDTDVASSLSSGKFEIDTNVKTKFSKTTRRQKIHSQSNERKTMILPSSLITRSLSQMSPNVGNIAATGNTNITTVTSAGGIFGNDETILSRLGVTQNRLPHGRKGIRNRRQTNVSDVSLKSDSSSGAACSGISATTASAKTRSKIGKIITSTEPSDAITFRTPTLVNRIETLSCTFDDDFYDKVNLNVRNNLSCHLDGKIDGGPTSPSPSIYPAPPIPTIRSTVVKSPMSNDSEIHAATSLAAITAFPTLLTADQYGCDIGSTKIKRPITKHSWKWKWDSVKKYKYVNEGGKFVKKVKQPMIGLRDLSKLDMWTQLTMRQKHEIAKKHSTNQIAQIGEHSKEEKQKQIDQLNRILDNRLLPQIVLEQNEQTIIKVEIDDDKTIYSVVSAAATSTTTTTTQNVNITMETFEEPSSHQLGFPFNLNLIPLASSSRAVKRTVILSGEWARPRCYLCFGCGAKFDKLKALDEHKMFRHPHVYSTHYEIVGRELIEGNLYKHFFIPSKALNRHHREFVNIYETKRMLMYKKTDEHLSREGDESLDSLHSISASCIETFSSSKSSDDCDTDTKTAIGTNSTSSSSSLLLLDVVPSSVNSTLLSKIDNACNDNAVALNHLSHNCTKCNRKCNGVLELYRHMLDCSGDYAWFMAKKRKYRYYGSKKRRPLNKQNVTALRMYRQNKLKEEQLKQSTSDGGTETPKKKTSNMSPSTPRPRPSDAESIKKMLENLPAKRVCREIIPNATKPKSRKLNKLTQQIKNITANVKTRKLQLKNLKMKSKGSTKTTKTLTAISKNILRSHKLRNIKKIATENLKQMKKKSKKFTPVVAITQIEDTTNTTLTSTSTSSNQSINPDDEPIDNSSSSNIENDNKSKANFSDKTEKGIVQKIGAKTKNFVKQIKKTFQSNKIQTPSEKENSKREERSISKPTKQSIVRKLSFEKCEEFVSSVANEISDKTDNGTTNEKSNNLRTSTPNADDDTKDCSKKCEIKNENPSTETVLNVEKINSKLTVDTEVIVTENAEIVQEENINIEIGDIPRSANQISPATKRRSKKINDCIAMLTGKLQEKMGKDLLTVSQDVEIATNKDKKQNPQISPIDQKIPTKRKAQSRRIVKVGNNVENDLECVEKPLEKISNSNESVTTSVENISVKDVTEQKTAKRKAQTRKCVQPAVEPPVEQSSPPKPQLKCKPVESLMQQPIIVNLQSEHFNTPPRPILHANKSPLINDNKTTELTTPELISISAKLAQISSNVTISKHLISNKDMNVPIVNNIIPSIEITPVKVPHQSSKNIMDNKLKTQPQPPAPLTHSTHSSKHHMNIPFGNNNAVFCTTISPSAVTKNIQDIPKPTVIQVPLRNGTSTSSFVDLPVPISLPIQMPPVQLPTPGGQLPTTTARVTKPANPRPCIPKRRQTISVAPNEFIFGLNPARMNSYNDFPFEIEVPLDLSKKSNKIQSPKRTTSLVLPPAPIITSSSAPVGLPKIKHSKESSSSSSSLSTTNTNYNQTQMIAPPSSSIPLQYPLIAAAATAASNNSKQMYPFHSNVELLKIPQVRNPTANLITSATLQQPQKPKRNTSKRNNSKKVLNEKSNESYLQQSQQELANLLQKNSSTSDKNQTTAANLFKDNRAERRPTAAELKEQINDHINDAISSVINAAVQEHEEEQRKLEKAADICKKLPETFAVSQEIASPSTFVSIPPASEILSYQTELPPPADFLFNQRNHTETIINSTTTQPICNDFNRKIHPINPACEKQGNGDFPTTTSTPFSEIVKQKNPPDKAAADTTTPQDNISSENTTESHLSKDITNVKPKRRSTRRKTIDCKTDLQQQSNEAIVTPSAQKEVDQIASNSFLKDVDHDETCNVTEGVCKTPDNIIPIELKEKLIKTSSSSQTKTADSTQIKNDELLENVRKTRSKLPSPDTTANTNTTSSSVPSTQYNEPIHVKPTTQQDVIIEKPSSPTIVEATVAEEKLNLKPSSPSSANANTNTMNSTTQKKQRRRRKNELAAIVADQLLESFKEVDKSRLDDLKKLENLAYEKSEDLFLTGMRLMPTTKRKTANLIEADVSVETQQTKGSKRLTEKQTTQTSTTTTTTTTTTTATTTAAATTITTTTGKGTNIKKNSKKITAKKTPNDDLVNVDTVEKNTQKSNSPPPPRLSLDKSSQFKDFGTYRINRDTLQLPFPYELQTPPITPAKTSTNSISNITPDSVDAPPLIIPDQTSNAKKSKKKQLKKRDKFIENENINTLRSDLESFTIGIEHIDKKREKSDSTGMQVFDYHKTNDNPTLSMPRNSSSILRPSILAATLDHNSSKEISSENNTIAAGGTTNDLPAPPPSSSSSSTTTTTTTTTTSSTSTLSSSAAPTKQPKERKTVASSRDPRLNKNIHNEEMNEDFLTHRESRLASLRQRRNANFPAFNQRGRLRSSSRQSIDDKQQQQQQQQQQKNNAKSSGNSVFGGNVVADDDDDDNYLTEIAKKVNENIMSAEDKDFNLANDGFELANSFLVGNNNGGEPYSRPSTSMSVCSAPNLNDDRSNFDTMDTDENTNTELIDMDLDDDMSVYTTFSQDASRSACGGRRRKRRRRSILLNRKPKKTNPNDLTNQKFECHLCNKIFFKSTALMKHQMTLAHVSKVSEQEYLNATANDRKKDESTKILERNQNKENALNSSSPPSKTNDMHHRHHHHHPIGHSTPVQVSIDASSNVAGEDKRKTTVSGVSRTTTTITTIAMENELPKQQQQPLTMRNQQTPSQPPPLPLPLPQQHQHQHQQHQPSTTGQPYIPLNSVLNQAGIEPISSPEQNCERDREREREQKTYPPTNSSSRLTLNPDERLFFECCNILKGSETPLVERSYPIPDSNNSSYVYDFQVKSVTPKSTSERFTYLKPTNESRNVGVSGGNSRKDCNYPSIDLNQFSDISSDSNPAQAPIAVLPDSYNMHLPAPNTTDIKNSSNLLAPPAMLSAVHTEPRIDNAEPHGAPTVASLPSATARTFVNQPSQLVAGSSHCLDNNHEYNAGYAVPSSSLNFQKQNFTSPLHSASSQGSTITTICRLKTKAAMKGYDNLKVSIPTIGLDMEQALERSPRPGCKLTALAEIALGNEKPMQSYPAIPSHHTQEAATDQQIKTKINNSEQMQQAMTAPIYNQELDTNKRREREHQQKSSDIQLETDECIPVPVIENKTNRRLSSAKDVYEFDDSENTPSSKAIMHSSFAKATTDAADAVASVQKKVIVIPERPFKNIGLEEKEPIKFQKPEAPPSPINQDDNTSSTVSYSDRDDFVYGSLSGGEDDDEDDDDNDDDNDGAVEKDECNVNLEDESSDSSAATAKTYENKSHIMGRIFKNVTTKSKASVEKMKDYPVANNEVIPPQQTQPTTKQIPKQDLDRLFDKLRGVNDNRKNTTTKVQQQNQQLQQQNQETIHQEKCENVVTANAIPPAASPASTPTTTTTRKAKATAKKTAKGKGKGRPTKSLAKANAITTTKPTNTRKDATKCANKSKKEIKQLHSELGMTPEEIAELIGEGQRKSQRRCAVNRQKKLVEMWSSDEYEEFLSTKDIFALIEEKEQKQTKRKRKLSASGPTGTGANAAWTNNNSVHNQQTQSTANIIDKKTKSTKKPNAKTKNNDQATSGGGDLKIIETNQLPLEDYGTKQKKSSPIETATTARKIAQRRNSTYVKSPPVNKSKVTKKNKKNTESVASADSDSDFEVHHRRGSNNITTTTTTPTTPTSNAPKSQSIRNRRKTIAGKIEIEKQPKAVGKKAIAALKDKIAMDSQQQTKQESMKSPTAPAATASKAKNKTNQNVKNGNKSMKRRDETREQPQLRPQARRKRIASEMLYYWSSSSDEEFGRIETPQDDEDDLDEGEHYQQHGWIVGDSHKKLVTLLAIAKGNKKVDDCGVKEINSKKKT